MHTHTHVAHTRKLPPLLPHASRMAFLPADSSLVSDTHTVHTHTYTHAFDIYTYKTGRVKTQTRQHMHTGIFSILTQICLTYIRRSHTHAGLFGIEVGQDPSPRVSMGMTVCVYMQILIIFVETSRWMYLWIHIYDDIYTYKRSKR